MPGPTNLERAVTWLRGHVMLVDAGLAALLALFLVLVTVSAYDPVETLLGLALLAPLAWRRVATVPAAAVVVAVGLAELVVAGSFLPANVSALIMVYSLAAYAPRWAARTGLVTGVIGAVLAAVTFTDFYGSGYGSAGQSLFVVASISVTVVAAYALGALRRIRLLQVAGLEERARLLEVEREQELRLAASTERSRIAREMHDVVAHSLSVVITQADGGRYAGRSDPDSALSALEAIAATGRQALTDMRGLLGVLRQDGPEARVPQPDAEMIPELVDDVRASGLDVDLLVDGTPRQLAAGPGLAAYRIVQESLTNVLKHAGPTRRAWVQMRWQDRGVAIDVYDDGRGAAATPGAGHGLIGMRERAELYGGTLSSGPRPGGGYAVRATIPYAPRS